MARSGGVLFPGEMGTLTSVNAWSLVAAWVGVSIPVSIGLGLVLSRGNLDRAKAPRSTPVPATPTSRIA
jgi:hypothetical protein